MVKHLREFSDKLYKKIVHTKQLELYKPEELFAEIKLILDDMESQEKGNDEKMRMSDIDGWNRDNRCEIDKSSDYIATLFFAIIGYRGRYERRMV